MKRTLYQQRFTGKPDSLRGHNLSVRACVFAQGKASRKKSNDIEFHHILLGWKCPLWHRGNSSPVYSSVRIEGETV